MIWLIGNKGMLGTEVSEIFDDRDIVYFTSDIEVDITDFNALEDFVKDKDITWIVNCSAYTAVDKAEDEKERAFSINADGVLNIAKIAKKKKAKLIHISTDYVFDGHMDGEYIEEDIPKPAGIYGESKLAGETNIINNIDSYFILRISWLFGKNGNNFVYTMLRLFKERDEVRVVSDQWGSPTYTKDVADMISKIIIENSNKYGIYHFTNEGKINWFEFASYIYKQIVDQKLLKKDVRIIPITTEEFPTKAKRPKNSYMSKEKIKKAFDLKIPTWQESLDIFLSHIDNN